MTDLHELALEMAAEKLAKVNRLEVIDETGRGYIRYFKEDEHLTYQFQDDDRTLKIFVEYSGKEYYYPGTDPDT